MFGWLSEARTLGFALEARKAVGISGEDGREDLERHVAIQLRIAGAIDLTHAARADERQDLICAETSAGRE
jgi:hypothetical protein